LLLADFQSTNSIKPAALLSKLAQQASSRSSTLMQAKQVTGGM